MIEIDKLTVMLSGRTGSGKTSQLGQIIKWIWKEHRLRSRIWVVDPGGIGPLLPFVDQGLLDPIFMETTDPWVFAHQAARGRVRDGSGGWKDGDNSKVGGFLFEGGSSIGEAIKSNLAEHAAQGENVAGGGMYVIERKDEGVEVSIGGNNIAHYGVGQQFIYDIMLESFRLPGKVIAWTSRLSKNQDDQQAVPTIVGPEILGKAKTGDVPAWFNLSLRLDVDKIDPRKHIMYLGEHRDEHTIGKPLALGNARAPLDAQLKETMIEPADVIKAFGMLKGLREKAGKVIKNELQLPSDMAW